jgi:hypothetical protein
MQTLHALVCMPWFTLGLPFWFSRDGYMSTAGLSIPGPSTAGPSIPGPSIAGPSTAGPSGSNYAPSKQKKTLTNEVRWCIVGFGALALHIYVSKNPYSGQNARTSCLI